MPARQQPSSRSRATAPCPQPVTFAYCLVQGHLTSTPNQSVAVAHQHACHHACSRHQPARPSLYHPSPHTSATHTHCNTYTHQSAPVAQHTMTAGTTRECPCEQQKEQDTQGEGCTARPPQAQTWVNTPWHMLQQRLTQPSGTASAMPP